MGPGPLFTISFDISAAFLLMIYVDWRGRGTWWWRLTQPLAIKSDIEEQARPKFELNFAFNTMQWFYIVVWLKSGVWRWQIKHPLVIEKLADRRDGDGCA